MPAEYIKPVQDIKLELLRPAERSRSAYGPSGRGFEPEEVAACYLALVLRHSRQWFLEARRDLLRDFESFSWKLNLGVPSPCVEDNEQNRIFRRIGRAGWLLSTLPPETLVLGAARTQLQRVEDPDYRDNDNALACELDIVPEIAAAAVGYAMSDMGRDGLHMIVDVGASTVDACTFLLGKQEDSDRYSLLIADVKRLGTASLQNYRLLELEVACQKHLRRLRNDQDALMPIDEDDTSNLIPHEVMMESLAMSKERFRSDLHHMLRTLIWQTKRRRYPRGPIWQTGSLPVLVIGGGIRSPFFLSAIHELDAWLRRHTRNRGITVMYPPLPETLERTTGRAEDSLFLAVAWGLSNRVLDIGTMVPADEMPEAEKLPELRV